MILKIIFLLCIIVFVSCFGAILMYISCVDDKFNEEEKDGKENKS